MNRPALLGEKPTWAGRYDEMRRQLPQPSSTLAYPAAAMADDPIVIAHRGASGYRPEHTLAGYALADTAVEALSARRR